MKQKDTVASVRALVESLHKAGFKGTIEFHYSGCSDSGDIEPPVVSPELLGAIHGLGYEFDYGGGYTTDPATGEWVRIKNSDRVPLLSIISELLPGGWEINEGSSGTVRLCIDDCTVRVVHDENVTTTSRSEWNV